MKTQNTILIATVAAFAFALAPVTQAAPNPGGFASRYSATEQPSPGRGPAPADEKPEAVELPVVTIHSTDNATRGKMGSFVLDMKPALMFGGTYVNFKISGTAIPGVDYVAPVSPAYMGSSGYGVISIATLANRRGSFNRQAYSVVVTLEPGAGYAVGATSSAQMWIK